MSMCSEAVVFPPPPPTTNSLTAAQRSQLLRKTKKLEQILGATPHLLDASVVSVLGPVYIELPYKPNRASLDSIVSSTSSSSSSDHSHTSSSTHGSTSSHYSTTTMRRSSSARPRTPSYAAKFRTQSTLSWCDTSTSSCTEAWAGTSSSGAKLPPFLRLAMSPPPAPENIPASTDPSITVGDSPATPSSSSESASSSDHEPSSASFSGCAAAPSIRQTSSAPSSRTHSRSGSFDDVATKEDYQYLICPKPISNSSGPNFSASSDSLLTPTTPTFSINVPSASSVKLRKMERLRKKLGDGVPFDLVFPVDQGVETNTDEREKKPAVKSTIEGAPRRQYDDAEFQKTSAALSIANSRLEARRKAGGEVRAVRTRKLSKPKGIATSNSDTDKDLPLPPPMPRTPKPRGGISHSRDSLSEESSPHKASRRPLRKASLRPLPPIPSLQSLPPSPSSTISRSQNSAHVISKEKGKLFVIVESPDEHGSGCAQEFGVSDVSDWVVLDVTTDDRTNVWSTRKGYVGWPRPGLEVTSEVEAETDSPAIQDGPTKKDDHEVWPSSGNLGRKSWSYRKPPPSYEF